MFRNPNGPGCLFVVLLFVWGSASSHRSHDLALVVEAAFGDFVYVGSFQVNGYAPPSHSYEPLKLPESFNVGNLYVFHYEGFLDDADFAVKELPKRLRSAGATIIEAPSSKYELPSVNPGEHAWRVVFRYDSLLGTIYNTLDQKLFRQGGLKQGGNVNSFVLRFDRA